MACRTRLLVAVLAAVVAVAGFAAEADDAAADRKTLTDAGITPSPAGLLAFFRKRTPSDERRTHILDLIRRLGADQYSVREKAMTDLIALGAPVRPLVAQAVNDADPEVRKRARTVLSRVETVADDAQLLPAAARLLAAAKPAGAAETLLRFLPHIEDAETADEVARSLAPVAAGKDGEPVPAVVAALTDRHPMTRAAAADALARTGAKQREAVRKLLADPSPAVRRRVAQALLEARDRAAVPALIDLLSGAPAAEEAAAEELLSAVAGEQAPPAPRPDNAETRTKYREAWQRWWKEQGETIDLAKIDFDTVGRGLMLVATLDTARPIAGSVMAMDSGGKVRWRIDGLSYPICVTRSRRDRVLVCEYSGSRVSERDLRGRVVWEKVLPIQVLAAERLRGGMTFVVARKGLMELDRAGNPVKSIDRPAFDVLTGHRYPDGSYMLLTTTGNCERLDSAGKRVSGFSVGFLGSPMGFRAHFLPSGGVVVPDYSRSKVREYDAAGKVVWETDAFRPNAVVRLANGHTLIASRMRNRIWEVDRTGKEVAGWSTDGRPLFVDRR